jgi:hypothetical protein
MIERLMLALLLALACGHGTAQTLWRCGPDGRQFQDRPCTMGQAVTLQPAPPAAAVQEARQVSQGERLALQTLATERRQREAEAAERGLGPAGIKPAPKVQARPSKRPPKRRHWTAGAPEA